MIIASFFCRIRSSLKVCVDGQKIQFFRFDKMKILFVQGISVKMMIPLGRTEKRIFHLSPTIT